MRYSSLWPGVSWQFDISQRSSVMIPLFSSPCSWAKILFCWGIRLIAALHLLMLGSTSFQFLLLITGHSRGGRKQAVWLNSPCPCDWKQTHGCLQYLHSWSASWEELHHTAYSDHSSVPSFTHPELLIWCVFLLSFCYYQMVGGLCLIEKLFFKLNTDPNSLGLSLLLTQSIFFSITLLFEWVCIQT